MRNRLDSPLVRLAVFGAALVLVAAVAAALGRATHAEGEAEGSTSARATGDAHADHAQEAPTTEAQASGLATVGGGYALAFDETELAPNRPTDVRFRILDAEGRALRDPEVEGGVAMHLIVVRRDLVGYQHLHPRVRADGTWSTPIRLRAPGVYRAFADFEQDGRRVVLGSDLFVRGMYTPEPLAPEATATRVGEYRVELDAHPRAGAESELAFHVTRNGTATELQPYLGAQGHLVALRSGDLAYLHVHPVGGGTRGEIRFAATFPSPRTYRLFLQFKDRGRVHTAPFTLEVRH